MEAFDKGVRSFQEGLSEEQNPYDESRQADLFKRWQSGFRSARGRSIEHAPRGE